MHMGELCQGPQTTPKPSVEQRRGKKLVSICLPIYKRLEYLPHILEIVATQDYPAIELIVSDNGRNGPQLRERIASLYRKPFRFRQNDATVEVARHFNQIIDYASGEYCFILCDDDEISGNYISELVSRLEQHPKASVAIARQEIINAQGEVIRKAETDLPSTLSGPEFIRAAWLTYRFRFECFATFLARTRDLKRCGGYAEFTRGNYSDNALLLKLCVDSHVVFGSDCVFRWRVEESSQGWSVKIGDLAKASREFLRFLRTDPILVDYGKAHPEEWRALRECLERMTWETYLWRWRDLYRKRLSAVEWMRAAFLLPFIPEYYRKVGGVFGEEIRQYIGRSVNRPFKALGI
jgi:glycosyltransferase involved in cell wall biosynthesis